MNRSQVSLVNLFILVVTTIFFNTGFASTLGTMASGALGPVSVAGDMINACSQIIGVGLLVASVIRYAEHRKRPVQVRIATPILFFLFGIFLTCLPYIASYSSSPKSAENISIPPFNPKANLLFLETLNL